MARRKKGLPLAIAEYELTLTTFSASTIITRQLLLTSMAQYAPFVLTDLSGELFEIHNQVTGLVMEPGGSKSPYVPKEWYQALSDWRYLHDIVRCGEDDIEYKSTNSRIPRWRIDCLKEALQDFRELHDGVNTWTNRWHLNVNDEFAMDSYFGFSFLKRAALFALFFNSALGEDIKKGWLEAATIPDGLPSEIPHVPPKPFIFNYRPGWSPTSQKRSDVTREIRNAFELQLSQYLNDQEALAQMHPYLGPAPRNVNEEHIKWLVYYQLHSWSYQRIANDLAYRNRKSVEQAVKAVAERVGLILRPPGKGGRPRSGSLSNV